MLASAQDPHNRFTMNIFFASMVGAIYLLMNEKPSAEQMIPYVRESVMKNKIFLKFVVSEKTLLQRGRIFGITQILIYGASTELILMAAGGFLNFATGIPIYLSFRKGIVYGVE